MKTNFRPRSRASSPLTKRLAIVVAALVIGMIVFYFGRPVIVSAVRPLWLGDNAITRGIANLGLFLRDKNALAEENRILKEKISSYENLEASYRAMESARDDLLTRFGRSPLTPTLAAGVLSRPPETPYDLLVIDAGTAEGALLGDKVSLPEGGALGKVSESFESVSKVTLYTAGGVKTEAVLERGHVSVTLTGIGGGGFEFTLPRGVAVMPGDKILLPGIRAELVGVVSEIDLEPTDAEIRVLARSVINLGSIRFVSVH